jgi:carbon monoxide dehydrogenase subunit G
MRLEKEFVVGAPLDGAWRAVSDAGVIAACLPGEFRLIDDVYAGRLELDANGSRIPCQATLRAVDQDDDRHLVTVVLHARQLRGPGIGAATLRSRCEAADGSTRVSLTAEVLSSGHTDREDVVRGVAQHALDQAAELLEKRAVEPPAPTAPAGPAERPGGPAAPAPGATAPVPSAAKRDPRRGLAVAGGVVLAVALGRRLLGRRRSRLW